MISLSHLKIYCNYPHSRLFIYVHVFSWDLTEHCVSVYLRIFFDGLHLQPNLVEILSLYRLLLVHFREFLEHW